MNAFLDTIDNAVLEIEKLQKLIKKSSTNQIRSQDEKEYLKAVSLTWFHTHRPIIISFLQDNLVSTLDGYYQQLLKAAEISPVRQRCIATFKLIRTDLHKLRNENITSIVKLTSITVDTVPDFSNIVSDVEMKDILSSRWAECIKCIEGNAPLAAIVMMGGLLETLLLSRVNQLKNLAPVFTANASPKNPKTGQTLPLNEWTLRHYIDVGHELKWITQTGKDLGVVLRDYRNFIHPHKQKTYNVKLEQSDARILWEICKNIAFQLL
jgi:hypothetical protein